MKKSTIKTIRFALSFLKDLNYSIASHTTSSRRFSRAKLDLIRDDEAIADFEKFVAENFLNKG